jgi:hypothetical protein
MDHSPSFATVVRPAEPVVLCSQNWHLTKIVVRSASLFFAAVLTALATVATIQCRSLAWKSSLPAGITIVCFDLADFALLFVRRNVKRGFHPGITVGGDLIVWLLCLACALIGAALNDTKMAWKIFHVDPYSVPSTGIPPIDAACEAFLVLLMLVFPPFPFFFFFCRFSPSNLPNYLDIKPRTILFT